MSTTLTADQVLAELKAMTSRRRELTEARASDGRITAAEMRERAGMLRREAELWDGLVGVALGDPEVTHSLLMRASAAAATRASERAAEWALDALASERAAAAAAAR